MGSQLSRKYDIQPEPCTRGGIGSPWGVYSANSKADPALTVSVFLCDKRKCKKTDSLFAVLKAEAYALKTLRCPGILHLIELPTEDPGELGFVSEPVKYCLGSLLRQPQELTKVLADVDIRLGLLDVIQALSFLHYDARLVHFNVCPESIYITPRGKWKLGGFGFASSMGTDQRAALLSNGQDMLTNLRELRQNPEFIPSTPLAQYSAHEVVSTLTGTPYSDVFSLACTIFAVYKALRSSDFDMLRLELLTIEGHAAACASAGKNVGMECVPEDLPQVLQRMTEFRAVTRANLHEVSESQAFQAFNVRALYYIEHLSEKNDLQKLQFFEGLSTMISEFDQKSVLTRVLPALIQYLSVPSLAVHVLPSLVKILKSLLITGNQFRQEIMPAFTELLEKRDLNMTGFVIILENIELFVRLVGEDISKSHLIPLVFEAYECNIANVQRISMERTPGLAAEIVDMVFLRTDILPAFLKALTKTSCSEVQVAGLQALAQIALMFDKLTITDTILPVLHRLSVHLRDSTAFDVLISIYKSLSAALGPTHTAKSIAPSLIPLLAESHLTKEQLEQLSATIIQIVQTVTEQRLSEIAEARTAPLIVERRRLDIDDDPNALFTKLLDEARPKLEVLPRRESFQYCDIFVNPRDTSAHRHSGSQDYSRRSLTGTVPKPHVEPGAPMNEWTPKY